MGNFEIHDLTVNEILSDNLDFDDVPVLFKAYQDFYTDHEIAFCERIEEVVIIYTRKNYSHKAEFYKQYDMLVEENICNLYEI